LFSGHGLKLIEQKIIDLKSGPNLVQARDGIMLKKSGFARLCQIFLKDLDFRDKILLEATWNISGHENSPSR
jgi:hypothetical protein